MNPATTAFVFLFLTLGSHVGWTQNLVDRVHFTNTAAPVTVTEAQVDEVLQESPVKKGWPESREAARVKAKLNRETSALVDGWPWLPFHHTLGISGYEAYFAHSDELFLAIARAWPFLDSDVRRRVKTFAENRLADIPPYLVKVEAAGQGRAREFYDVPMSLRARSSSEARSAIGVYAFWAWCWHAGDPSTVSNHWAALHLRIRPLLAKPSTFDPRKTNYTRNEAEILNGDIAGLIGFIRMARTLGETEMAGQARGPLRELLGMRLNLERVNPHILERTPTSKNLHAGKLTRYCALVPELGRFLRQYSDGLAARRLRDCRERRNAWYLAFGDRFIGGENYTNPPHFPRALHSGAVWIEQLPPGELLSFVDIPWCKGDYYFIEKCADALWADGSYEWENVY